MRRPSTWLVLLVVLAGLVPACKEPKPALSGRMRSPSDMVQVLGCPQGVPACNRDPEASPSEVHHLLLIVNSMGDDIRIFDTERRAFFKAFNPLFPFSIPVGSFPRAIAVDPYADWAFVVNALSQDLSLVNLAPDRLVEVDTDGDQSTTATSLHCPQDPNAPVISDRCLAGVSRVGLGDGESLYPEQIATPKGAAPDPADPAAVPWDRTAPLPVLVSLSGSGQLALLQFLYPGDGLAQRMEFVETVDVGGMPSGMAITRDGATAFAADEASDSIISLDLATRTVARIAIGGPTRRVYLTPDESVLYVLWLNENRISLVDVATGQKVPPGQSTIPESWDPEGEMADIALPGIPRDITFVAGQSISVQNADLVASEYPLDGEKAVGLFAYVSDLNGNIYILDAENHQTVDVLATTGPSISQPGYVQGGQVYSSEELDVCVGSADCAFPHIADFDRSYDGIDEFDPIYFGIWTRPGITRSEGWILTFEGVLPGTSASKSGVFEGWYLVDDRMGLDYVESGAEVGDRLQILSPPRLADDGSGDYHDACLRDSDGALITNFTIDSVTETILGIQQVAGVDPGLCWPEAFSYQVRAMNAWTVFGTVSGPQERLTMIPFESPPPDPPAYDNGYIGLTMFEPGLDEAGNPIRVPRDSAWGFTSDDGFLHAQFAPSIRAGLAGRLVAVDMDNGAEPNRPDDSTLTGPADDRIYLLFEASNALMEFFPDNLSSTNYLLYQ